MRSTAGSMADELDAVAEARAYIESLPTVDLNQYDLRKLTPRRRSGRASCSRASTNAPRPWPRRTASWNGSRNCWPGDLKGKKVLIFSTFKDTTRYLHRRLTERSPSVARSRRAIRTSAASTAAIIPTSGATSSPSSPRSPAATDDAAGDAIDILISTDVLSEGQNLQDCGVIINYDLTWNPIRLVQRNGRIDRIGSPHAEIGIYNLFPEDELEALLHLVERLTEPHLDHRRPRPARRQRPGRSGPSPDVQHPPAHPG